jgi:hypothetical protein
MKQYSVAKAKHAEQYYGLFTSIEEALQKGPAELGYDGTEREIFIGEANLFQPHISASDVLEQLENDCGSQCGEAAEVFSPSQVEQPAQDELEVQLNAVLIAWLEKHNEMPTCWSVSNATRYELKK